MMFTLFGNYIEQWVYIGMLKAIGVATFNYGNPWAVTMKRGNSLNIDSFTGVFTY